MKCSLWFVSAISAARTACITLAVKDSDLTYSLSKNELSSHDFLIEQADFVLQRALKLLYFSLAGRDSTRPEES